MALILAIENNRQQGAQLKSIVQGLGAELVLAQSAEHAFAAVGDRVPDLILIPLLLSPQDDAALSNRLRELGSAASHVRTLSIPILAAPSESPGGTLSILRIAEEKESPVGCAPEVFAGQLREYLDGAVREREWAAPQVPHPTEPSAVCTTESAEGAEGNESAERGSVMRLAAPAAAAPATVDAPTLDERRMIGDAQRAAEEALRAAANARVREEQRAVQATLHANKAEARLRAAEEALHAAASARTSEEQRAAKAAADADKLEARVRTAEDASRTAEEASRSAAGARTRE